MIPADLAPLLAAFYSERLALLQRHVASARAVTDYDVNNAYQYIIAREEMHVLWVHKAIVDVGGTVPVAPAEPSTPAGSVRDIAAADAAASQAFESAWTPKVATVGHARHRKMLQVILGEVLEHQRLFAQAGEGRTDVIGTPVTGTTRVGAVLATRWVE